jgi:organic radical activating enzyme
MDYPFNEQPIEKRTNMFANKHENLDVQSIFYTIQGEGPFCGTPAVFIRLAGCNLQCPACDTDYTSQRRWISTDDIVTQVQHGHMMRNLSLISEFPFEECLAYYKGLVVITGGEPFRQEIDLLVLKLQQRLGCYVQVETNGTLPPPSISTLNTNVNERRGLYIVVSPKTGRVARLTAESACAYKYVMNADSVDWKDGLPMHVLDHKLGTLSVARPPEGYKGLVYLQPQDDRDKEKNQRNLDACVESCMRHGYILQLQVHKLLGME